MRTRRDFLAFMAGAIVARTILPAAAARAAPEVVRGDLDARMLALYRGMPPHMQRAALRLIRRVHDGMDMEQAGSLFRAELGMPQPGEAPA